MSNLLPKSLFGLALIVFPIFLFGCSDNNSASPPPNNRNYPQPAPSGVWDPSQPQPTPIYNVPTGWTINPENPWQSRSDHQDVQLDLGVLSKPQKDVTAQSWRDQRYDFVKCHDQGEKDLWVNCSKGFTKAESTIDGKKIYLLQYFGTTGDLNQSVTESFWNGPDWAEALVIQGDFDEAAPVVESLLSTLHYQYQVPQENFQK